MGQVVPSFGKGELSWRKYSPKGTEVFSTLLDFSDMTQDEITALFVALRMEDGSNT